MLSDRRNASQLMAANACCVYKYGIINNTIFPHYFFISGPCWVIRFRQFKIFFLRFGNFLTQLNVTPFLGPVRSTKISLGDFTNSDIFVINACIDFNVALFSVFGRCPTTTVALDFFQRVLDELLIFHS